MLATQTLIQKKVQEHARHRERRAARGRHLQGHHPRHHRRDGDRRRHRPRHRVWRRRHQGALHGRAHDGLQHDHRGRRPRRPGGAGRDHLRIPEGPPDGPEGRGLGAGHAVLGDPALRRRRRLRRRDHSRSGRAAADRHLGHQPGGRGLHHRRSARSRLRGRRGQARPYAPGARLYGSDPRHQGDRHRHRPGVHRVVHQWPHRGPARRGQGGRRQACQRERQRHDRAGLRHREGAGGVRKASTRSSPPRASSGASRAAPCAWP